MATIKSYTDIEQSLRLAKILPTESADMYYFDNLLVPKVGYSIEVEKLYNKTNIYYIPCWSLAALLELLELPTLRKDSIGGIKIGWMVIYYGAKLKKYESTYYNNPIDACVEMILKLHELKML